jgi:hypothetical protein
MLKRDELVKLISNAFPKEPYPKEFPITYKDTFEGSEEHEIAQAFYGKSWEEIDSKTAWYHSAALVFFTPQAYRYFLPAYLKLCVTNWRDVDHAANAVIYSLELPNKVKNRPRFFEVVDEFTDVQKNVIAHFLEYIDKTYGENFPIHGPSIALNSY